MIGNPKELEELFKKIKATSDNEILEMTITKGLKKEIEALEKLAGIINTIGATELIKIYMKKKTGGM